MAFSDTNKFVKVIIDEANILNAMPRDVLQGKTFVGRENKFQGGEIPVNEEKNDINVLSGTTTVIPYGYNPKQYSVIVPTLGDQTPANATSSDIKLNTTAWVNGVLVVGAMPIIPDEDTELNAGETLTIAEGYHNGLGSVRAKNMAAQTEATAEAYNILFGKTAWVYGVLVVGTMVNNIPTEINLNAGSEYPIPIGYHNGSGVVKARALDIQTVGTATASEIAFGKTAWVNGESVVGTMPAIAAQEIILPLNGTYPIPEGYHGGLGYITQDLPVIEGLTITPTFEQQIIPTAGSIFTEDIIVTGINTMNYTVLNGTEIVFDNSKSGLNLTVPYIYAIPTDNRHDQNTTNIYQSLVYYYDGVGELSTVDAEESIVSISNLTNISKPVRINIPMPESYMNRLYMTTTISLNGDTKEQTITLTFELEEYVDMGEGMKAFISPRALTTSDLLPDVDGYIGISVSEMLQYRQFV